MENLIIYYWFSTLAKINYLNANLQSKIIHKNGNELI